MKKAAVVCSVTVGFFLSSPCWTLLIAAWLLLPRVRHRLIMSPELFGAFVITLFWLLNTALGRSAHIGVSSLDVLSILAIEAVVMASGGAIGHRTALISWSLVEMLLGREVLRSDVALYADVQEACMQLAAAAAVRMAAGYLHATLAAYAIGQHIPSGEDMSKHRLMLG